MGDEVRDGIVAGLIASVPQVLVTQAVERLLDLPAEKANIGPRFVQRLDQHLETDLSPTGHWVVAGLFHFGYAALWGALYGLLQRQRPTPPHVAGPAMAGVIYAAAFSRIGAATQAGAEPPPDRRPKRELALHWTPALTFSMLTAYGFDWLNRRRSTR